MTEKTTVVGIHGKVDIEEPMPSAAVINTLEEVLAKARAGEIVGVAIAINTRSELGEYVLGGRVCRYELLGAVSRMNHELNVLIRDDDGS